MVFRVENQTFAKGERVRLGSGETGTIVERKEQDGFSGYLVKITDGPRKGSVVGAAPGGMVKVSTLRRTRARVMVNGKPFDCRVARGILDQAQGLQPPTPKLSDGEGMLFEFDPPRAATFHMGKVAYPIDIMFIAPGNRVTKVVHNAQPGTAERWSAPLCKAVLEVPGGTLSGRRTAAEPMNDPEHYEISFPNEVEDQNGPGEDRFKDHSLPDVADSNADAMSNAQWKQQIGYSPLDYPDGEGAPTTRAAQVVSDPAELVIGILRHVGPQLAWHRDKLNPSMAYAIITQNDIADAIGAYGMKGSAATDVLAAATAPSALNMLGDSLVMANLADRSQVQTYKGQDAVILWEYTKDD